MWSASCATKPPATPPPRSSRRMAGPRVGDPDERPRRDTPLEALATLRPSFRANGTVTAGNASGINDGAAAVLLMSREKAESLGLKPWVRWVASGAAGGGPRTLGDGPPPAARQAAKRGGRGG